MIILKRFLLRLILIVAGVWISGILLFAFLPVPFSAVMAERQASAWLNGDFHYISHSTWVPIEDIAVFMPLAVIASEDQGFPQHGGFDVHAIKSVLSQHGDSRMRGASTLSQQTAKNMFLWDGRSWIRKGLEAVITVGIETVWGKKRILTVYLNVAEFGQGIFGVEAAARHYFHKSAGALTLSEAALLAAVLPNPIALQVSSPSAYVRQRQQWIIHQMSQLGGTTFLTDNNLR